MIEKTPRKYLVLQYFAIYYSFIQNGLYFAKKQTNFFVLTKDTKRIFF